MCVCVMLGLRWCRYVCVCDVEFRVVPVCVCGGAGVCVCVMLGLWWCRCVCVCDVGF